MDHPTLINLNEAVSPLIVVINYQNIILGPRCFHKPQSMKCYYFHVFVHLCLEEFIETLAA
jgi:hypothetical protein